MRSVVNAIVLTGFIGLGNLSGQQSSSIKLTTSSNPFGFGKRLTITATLAPADVTGKVTFYDGTSILGTSAVAGGKAVLVTSLLASGTRSLTARYLGNASYFASLSPALSQTINAAPGRSFRP